MNVATRTIFMIRFTIVLRTKTHPTIPPQPNQPLTDPRTVLCPSSVQAWVHEDLPSDQCRESSEPLFGLLLKLPVPQIVLVWPTVKVLGPLECRKRNSKMASSVHLRRGKSAHRACAPLRHTQPPPRQRSSEGNYSGRWRNWRLAAALHPPRCITPRQYSASIGALCCSSQMAGSHHPSSQLVNCLVAKMIETPHQLCSSRADHLLR